MSFRNKFSVKYLVLITCILGCSSTVISQTPPNNLSFNEETHIMSLEGLNTSAFYDESILESVYLEFYESDYWQQLHDCYDTENYVMATLRYKGEVLDSIGAQFKGNTSYSKVTNDEKYSFAISLDEFVDGLDIEDYNTLNFNNAFGDPSFMKEVLYNSLNRRNIPSAKANFIKLYINGEYWGIYANVQQLNKDFTKEWFMTNNGSLWRGVAPPAEAETANTTSTALSIASIPPGGGTPNWGDGTTALNYLGTDTLSYQEYYTLKHSSQENPWDLLLNVCDILNNTSDADLQDSLSQYMDIDKTLWFLAHETVFSDDDSYIMKGKQDYYAYYEPETQRFVPLEFDGNSAMNTRNVDWDLFYNEENENFPLMNRLYAVPELRQRYLAHVRTIIEELLDVELTDSLIDEYDALIRSSVESDTKNPNTFVQYNTSMRQLKAFIVNRKNMLLSNSELPVTALSISGVEQRANDILFASPLNTETASISATISGEKDVDKIYLYYSPYYVGSFTKIEMLDDGAHNDGIADDGVYGAEIPAFPVGEYVRYYIEAIAADDAKTASYSPVGAEHDVYYYRVGLAESESSEVVINEICASNTSLVEDNEGDYDDWIELYNNSSEAISLAGYFLSDDIADPSMWALPDVMIEGNSYLIVWADRDEEQGEDHANFKLSASGEELYLIDIDGNIADQLAYSDLGEDETWGRIPNGTGSFESTNLSYASENSVYAEEVQTSLEKFEGLNIRLYPNPAKNYVVVETNIADAITLSLYNLQGVLMSKESITSTSTIDISHLSKGLYIVRVEGESCAQTTKLLIE